MKRLWLFAVALAVMLAAGGAEARVIGSRTSETVVVDTGDQLGGFNVSVGTSTTVLISSSGFNAHIIWRLRTVQVTKSPYELWIGTYTPLSWASGAGWLVAGSTGAYTTRSQGPLYGILNPAAGAGTCTIQGPFEYQAGEVPSQ